MQPLKIPDQPLPRLWVGYLISHFLQNFHFSLPVESLNIQLVFDPDPCFAQEKQIKPSVG